MPNAARVALVGAFCLGACSLAAAAKPVLPVLASVPAPPGVHTTLPGPKAAATYQLDDGTVENTAGLTGGGQFLWFNRFTPSPADFPLQVETVEVVFPGPPNAEVGQAVEIFLFQDTDGDGDPGTNAQLVGRVTGTIQAADWATASVYTINPPSVFGGPGDILVGVVNRAGSVGFQDYPAALDQTATQGRSWVAAYSTGTVPANPTLPPDALFAIVDSVGFPGNWAIRANVETNIPDTRPPVLLVNTGLAVAEGAGAVLTAAMLHAEDPDTNDSLLVYAVTSGPGNGQLELSSAPGSAITSFTQGQLDAGQVLYVHDDSETTSDAFGFNIEDGSGNDLAGQSFAITVTPVDDLAPVLATNAGLAVTEGGSGLVDASVLQATDPDTDDAQLVFAITSPPANGQLELASDPGVPVASFTQAQVDAGEVVYAHDDSETNSDGFTFSVQDGAGNDLTGQVFTIAVSMVDDEPPVLAVNTGLSVAEGGSGVIGTGNLQVTDADTAPADLAYTVTSVPAHGQLELVGAPGIAVTAFTQAQIDAGQLVYVHDDSNTVSDGFVFNVQDTGGNGLSAQSFAITVAAVGDDAVVVSPTSLDLVEGASGNFDVVLSTAPTGTVLVNLSTGDPAIATVTPAQLVFSPANWATPQAASVQATDDAVAGGARATIISVAVDAATDDDTYAALPASGVAVTTQDNDAAGVAVSPSGGLTTTEEGGSDSFSIVLQSQPTADVLISLASSDTTEGTVSPTSLTFTAANWSVPQVVTVTGVNDGIWDEDQAWSVLITSASADPDYDALVIASPGVVNGDDDEVPAISEPTIIPAASPGTLALLALLLLALGAVTSRGNSGVRRR